MQISLNKEQSAVSSSEKKLLYFGLDYLRINIASFRDVPNKTIRFINSIFGTDHNHTNTNSFDDFVWADTGQEVSIMFQMLPNGEAAFVSVNNHVIMRILRVSEKWAKPLRYKYKYMIDFYGLFFADARNDNLEPLDFLGILLDDTSHGRLDYSISRLDICADLANYTPRQIERSIKGNHLKKMNYYKLNKETKEIQGFDFGSKSTNQFFMRTYDKQADSIKKHKERIYRDYFDYNCVTRIEAEIHAGMCRDYDITLPKIMDLKFLWGVYSDCLDNKFYRWKVIWFIEKEMKKVGFKRIKISKDYETQNHLTRSELLSRLFSMMCNAMRRFELDIKSFLRLFADSKHYKKFASEQKK